MKRSIIKLTHQVKQKQPLIHNITNQVVMNFTANGLYAFGALPIMAYEPKEVAEITAKANALVLNIGTLTVEKLESMLIAGRVANHKGIPVVLDPVGVGATTFRTEAAQKLLSELDLALIRGNGAEISHLAGIDAKMRGIDAQGDLNSQLIIKQSVEKLKVPILMTGKTDYIANQKTIYKASNGSSMLTKVTGAGCLLSSLAAAYLAISEDHLLAATAAVSYFNIASEKAEERAKQPGQFQVALLDTLSETTADDLNQQINIEKVREY